MYGRNAFLEETANQCINDTYYDEIKKSGEKVLSQPKINVVQVDVTKPFIYEAEVAVVPDVKLGKYKGLSLKKTNIVISDEEDIEKVNEKIDEEVKEDFIDKK